MQIKILSTMMMFIFLFSGCTPKVITKIEYIKSPKYDFQKLNLDGVRIPIDEVKFGLTTLNKKEVRQICTSSMIKLNDIYKPSIKFYEDQIDNYLKGNK